MLTKRFKFSVKKANGDVVRYFQSSPSLLLSPNVPNRENETAIQIAVQNGFWNVAQSLFLAAEGVISFLILFFIV